VLSVERLDVRRGRTQVLYAVSLEVPAKSLTCVMGRNGVGKTTLLHAAMGVLRPSAGRVLLDGRDVTNLAPHLRVRAGMAYVPQGHGTFTYLTARESLQVVQESNRRPPSAVDDAIDLFPALKPVLGRRAGVLSGGQQQQLAIAMALVTQPRLLLLDEPTEGIQPSIILEIEETIARLHRSAGISILLVEQYVEFALRLADRYAVLDAGRVVAGGTTKDLDEASIRELVAL
jgi:urea transport system ATP-binding protein